LGRGRRSRWIERDGSVAVILVITFEILNLVPRRIAFQKVVVSVVHKSLACWEFSTVMGWQVSILGAAFDHVASTSGRISVIRGRTSGAFRVVGTASDPAIEGVDGRQKDDKSAERCGERELHGAD
jgi:hypothetical protein